MAVTKSIRPQDYGLGLFTHTPKWVRVSWLGMNLEGRRYSYRQLDDLLAVGNQDGKVVVWISDWEDQDYVVLMTERQYRRAARLF